MAATSSNMATLPIPPYPISRMNLHSSIPAVTPGDFAALSIPFYQAEMLSDAHKAVSSVQGGWDRLARQDVPFSEKDEIMRAIDAAMTYAHSGHSYRWTMRILVDIAKNGWNAYVATVCTPPPSRQQFVAAWQEFQDKKISYAEMCARIG